MAGEIVEDDDVTRLQGGCELGFDIGLEDCAVHRRINDPGSDETVAPEPGHEGLRAPVAEGGFAVQPAANCRAPAQARHLGRRAGLVNEDKAITLPAHEGLAAVFPFGPGLGQFRPVLFAGPQCFF